MLRSALAEGNDMQLVLVLRSCIGPRSGEQNMQRALGFGQSLLLLTIYGFPLSLRQSDEKTCFMVVCCWRNLKK